MMIKDRLSIVYVNKILGNTYSHTMLQLILNEFLLPRNNLCLLQFLKLFFSFTGYTIVLLRLNSIIKYCN